MPHSVSRLLDGAILCWHRADGGGEEGACRTKAGSFFALFHPALTREAPMFEAGDQDRETNRHVDRIQDRHQIGRGEIGKHGRLARYLSNSQMRPAMPPKKVTNNMDAWIFECALARRRRSIGIMVWQPRALRQGETMQGDRF